MWLDGRGGTDDEEGSDDGGGGKGVKAECKGRQDVRG